MMSHAEVERLTEQNFMTKAQDLTDRGELKPAAVIFFPASN